MVQPWTHSVLWGTSWNEIETTGVEFERPVMWYSQHLEIQLRANTEIATYTERALLLFQLALGHYLTTTDDYMCLLHEPTPINYTLMHEANTVQMLNVNFGHHLPKGGKDGNESND